MSLRARVLLAIISVSALLFGYLYGQWLPGQLGAREADYRRETQRHLASVAEGITPFLLGSQLDALYENLDALRARNGDWTAVVFTDVAGRELYPLIPSRNPLREEEDQPVIRQAIQYADTPLGTLAVKVDLRGRLGELRRKHHQLLLTSAAVAISFIVVLWLILDRGVRKPLLELAHASRQLAAGDFETPLAYRGKDEVSEAIESFKRMREAIKGYQSELVRKSAALANLSLAVQQSPIAIAITDARGRVEYVNPRFAAQAGVPAEEAFGCELSELATRTCGAHGRQLLDAMAAGENWKGEFSCGSDEGLRVSALLVPVRDAGGTIVNFLVTMEDVTRQRALEQQLRQAEKLETIGTLAGGIAHDFNNILTGILGYSELALVQTGGTGRIADHLGQVQAGIYRARDLAKQILMFSRKSEPQSVPLKIATVAAEALQLIRATIPTTIEIRQSLETDALIRADPTQIHQVVMNLCANAYQAMERAGGILGVSLREERVDNSSPVGADLPPGQYVVIEVSDTGHGMDEETVKRVFEPYFTTKDKGKGTGLGLAVVHGIVKSHAGAIRVLSAPGAGTTFTVYLPTLPAAAAVEPAKATGALRGNGERILFVDDEEQIRGAAGEYLSACGYRVEICPDGLEALARIESRPRDFDLLVTDMTMPGMDGLELSRRAAACRPDLPVLLCSGYSSRINAASAANLGVDFMEKPATMHELQARIRKALTAGKAT